MKHLVWVLLLSGCAGMRTLPTYTEPTYTPPPDPRLMTYQQARDYEIIDSRDCPRADDIIWQMDEQLRLRGFAGQNPEDLAPQDRRLNAALRINKWSIIIGCNNPNRYSKK